MQIVFLRDNLHGMLYGSLFSKKHEKYFKMLSTEIFTSHAKRLILEKIAFALQLHIQ